ncbi:hypothetical protein ACFL60_10020, partial [Candidatus Omnitrophota bacterium]
GMHLLHASKKRLEATVDAFDRYDIQVLGTCHCTGIEAITYLKSRFPDRFIDCSTGSRFTFGRKQSSLNLKETYNANIRV